MLELFITIIIIGVVMHNQTKELLEQANTLNILYRYIDDECGKHTFNTLQKYFSNITPVLDKQDVVSKYKTGKFDIVITNIDTITPISIQTCVNILTLNPDQEILFYPYLDE